MAGPTLQTFQAIVNKMTNDNGFVYVQANPQTNELKLKESDIGGNAFTKLFYASHTSNTTENRATRECLKHALLGDPKFKSAEMQKYLERILGPEFTEKEVVVGGRRQYAPLGRKELKDILTDVNRHYRNTLNRACDFGILTADITLLMRLRTASDIDNLVRTMNNRKLSTREITRTLNEAVRAARAEAAEMKTLVDVAHHYKDNEHLPNQNNFMRTVGKELEKMGISWNGVPAPFYKEKMDKIALKIADKIYEKMYDWGRDINLVLNHDFEEPMTPELIRAAREGVAEIKASVQKCVEQIAATFHQVEAITNGVEWVTQVAISNHLTGNGTKDPGELDLAAFNAKMEANSAYLKAWKREMVNEQLDLLFGKNGADYNFYAVSQSIEEKAQELAALIADPENADKAVSAEAQCAFTATKVIENTFTQTAYEKLVAAAPEDLRGAVPSQDTIKGLLKEELLRGVDANKACADIKSFIENCQTRLTQRLEKYTAVLNTFHAGGEGVLNKAIESAYTEGDGQLLGVLLEDKQDGVSADFRKILANEADLIMTSVKEDAIRDLRSEFSAEMFVPPVKEMMLRAKNVLTEMQGALMKQWAQDEDFAMLAAPDGKIVTDDMKREFQQGIQHLANKALVAFLSEDPELLADPTVSSDTLAQEFKPFYANIRQEMLAVRDSVLAKHITDAQANEQTKAQKEIKEESLEADLDKFARDNLPPAQEKIPGFDATTQFNFLTTFRQYLVAAEVDRLGVHNLKGLFGSDLVKAGANRTTWDRDEFMKRVKAQLTAAHPVLQKTLSGLANGVEKALRDAGFDPAISLDSKDARYAAIIAEVRDAIIGLTLDAMKGNAEVNVAAEGEKLVGQIRQWIVDQNALALGTTEGGIKSSSLSQADIERIAAKLETPTTARQLGGVTSAVLQTAKTVLPEMMEMIRGSLLSARKLNAHADLALAIERHLDRVCENAAILRKYADGLLAARFAPSTPPASQDVPIVEQMLAACLKQDMVTSDISPDGYREALAQIIKGLASPAAATSTQPSDITTAAPVTLSVKTQNALNKANEAIRKKCLACFNLFKADPLLAKFHLNFQSLDTLPGFGSIQLNILTPPAFKADKDVAAFIKSRTAKIDRYFKGLEQILTEAKGLLAAKWGQKTWMETSIAKYPVAYEQMKKALTESIRDWANYLQQDGEPELYQEFEDGVNILPNTVS